MASPNQTSSPTQPSSRRTPQNSSSTLVTYAVDAMADKKASDITVIDLREVSNMADFFVIGTGDSDLQVKAIANGIMDHIEDECGEQPWKREGMNHLRWVLLDYVDLVVHIFTPARREHYNIERLWGEANTETVPENGDASDLDLLEELLQQSPETT